MKIGESVRFKDTSGLNYQGTVINVRDGIVSVAVLGYDDLFRFQQNQAETLLFDRMVGFGQIFH